MFRPRVLEAGITKLRLVSYVLIQLAPGRTTTAAKAISKIKGVKMAHAVTGPFDESPLLKFQTLQLYRT